MRPLFLLTIVSLVLGFPEALLASPEAGAPHLDGSILSIYWALPFAGMLLSIAILPLFAPQFWHHNFGKIAAFWSLILLLPLTVQFGLDVTLYTVLEVVLKEYIPFILLLLALFTVSGGIAIRGSLEGTPALNASILAIGTVIASFVGTTGAAMLLIRPLLIANSKRRYRVHTVVFFIFLVANIGGSLTPLGDPPLFLGYLQGVDFTWPLFHMFKPWLFVSSILLAVYFIVDTVLCRKEPLPQETTPASEKHPIRITGASNILLLFAIIGVILLSGAFNTGIEFTLYHIQVTLEEIFRNFALLAITFISYKFTCSDRRKENSFDWFPIIEVAKLFAGIFITMATAISILQAGLKGALAPLVRLVTDDTGAPINSMYFWMTGLLSSFLDNAPTYVVFFNSAGGNAEQLMGPLATTLLAISAGAVFMGANSYIGNAPNFMVKSIAEQNQIKMPSFFGYIVWSIGILFPVFVLTSLIFF